MRAQSKSKNGRAGPLYLTANNQRDEIRPVDTGESAELIERVPVRRD